MPPHEADQTGIWAMARWSTKPGAKRSSWHMLARGTYGDVLEQALSILDLDPSDQLLLVPIGPNGIAVEHARFLLHSGI